MIHRDQAMVQQLIPGLYESTDVDWTRVVRSRYLVDQTFRYVYEEPIRDLRHRLIIEPPGRHGGQWARRSEFRTSSDQAFVSRSQDDFGNTVIEINAEEAGPLLDFQARIEVEREQDEGVASADARWLRDPRLLTCAGLTSAGPRIRAAAAELEAGGSTGLALAGAVNQWTRDAIRYQGGVTSVETTAEEALALGVGVCQDYAHVMLALCRSLGLAARYVSGHLLGDGGTHAWVEVLLPPAQPSDAAEAYAFDPTHGRPASVRYVTIAVGADYGDVAPTSGTYCGGPGELTTRKRVDIVGFTYD